MKLSVDGHGTPCESAYIIGRNNLRELRHVFFSEPKTASYTLIGMAAGDRWQGKESLGRGASQTSREALETGERDPLD